jgi:hypothetical protein
MIDAGCAGTLEFHHSKIVAFGSSYRKYIPV